jgi:hypothetical protein
MFTSIEEKGLKLRLMKFGAEKTTVGNVEKARGSEIGILFCINLGKIRIPIALNPYVVWSANAGGSPNLVDISQIWSLSGETSLVRASAARIAWINL